MEHLLPVIIWIHRKCSIYKKYVYLDIWINQTFPTPYMPPNPRSKSSSPLIMVGVILNSWPTSFICYKLNLIYKIIIDSYIYTQLTIDVYLQEMINIHLISGSVNNECCETNCICGLFYCWEIFLCQTSIQKTSCWIFPYGLFTTIIWKLHTGISYPKIIKTIKLMKKFSLDDSINLMKCESLW